MRVTAETAAAVDEVAARAAPAVVRTVCADVPGAGAPDGCAFPAQAVTIPAAATIAAARLRGLTW
jgi:hypothetical protein